jgi:hypothetical protein
MSTHTRGRMLAAWLACLSWLLPAPCAISAHPPAAPGLPGIWDVRLDQQGTLRGRLVDLEGLPVAGQELELLRGGQSAAQAVSGDAGQFDFAGLPAGVYQIHFDSCAVTCRAWTAAAAPPAARDQLVVLAAPATVRGQQPIQCLFRNPLFIGLVVAAAIAIPIAIHNAKDDRPPGS